MKLSEAIQIFLQRGDLAQGTKLLYSKGLEVFSEFIGNKEVEEIEITDITKFENYLFSVKSKSRASSIVCDIRVFFKYLQNKLGLKVLNPDSIYTQRVNHNHWATLTKAEFDKLVNTFGTSLHEKRDKAICYTLWESGLRIGDLIRLKKDDINLSRGEGKITTEKTGKEKLILFTEKGLKALNDYLALRDDDSPYLFISHHHRWYGQPLHTIYFRMTMPIWAKRIGLPRLHAHMFRKGCGGEMYRKTKDIRAVQEYLGHESVETTQLYTNTTDQDVRDCFNNSMSDDHEFEYEHKKNGKPTVRVRCWVLNGKEVPKVKKGMIKAVEEICS